MQICRPNPAAIVLDYFEIVRTHPTFKRFVVGELLFAQYTCPVREVSIGIWAHTDHLVHVLSGTKTWKTPSGSWTMRAGDTMFFKKGAYVLRQNFQEDFCVLVFFTPDAFVREVAHSLRDELAATPGAVDPGDMVIPLTNDAPLSGFLHSMAAYFAEEDRPPEPLLRLKFKELITGVLLGQKNRRLGAYFRTLACSDRPSVPAIMEANYCHNLSLEAFAKMCHRSLSSFKRKFQGCYGVAPGRWLLERRLDRAARLLCTTEMNVTEIVFECGFEAPAHFSRAFKERFQRSPREYREIASETAGVGQAGAAHMSGGHDRLLYDLATG